MYALFNSDQQSVIMPGLTYTTGCCGSEFFLYNMPFHGFTTTQTYGRFWLCIVQCMCSDVLYLVHTSVLNIQMFKSNFHTYGSYCVKVRKNLIKSETLSIILPLTLPWGKKLIKITRVFL